MVILFTTLPNWFGRVRGGRHEGHDFQEDAGAGDRAGFPWEAEEDRQAHGQADGQGRPLGEGSAGLQRHREAGFRPPGPEGRLEALERSYCSGWDVSPAAALFSNKNFYNVAVLNDIVLAFRADESF